MTLQAAAVGADPLHWLEELDSPRARAFVAAQNARTLAALGDPRGSPLFGRLLETETTDTDGDPLRKLPQVTELGGLFYDFWSDGQHPRGVWRRTTLESFLSDAPRWEVVLDLEVLGKQEEQNFVWRGYDALLEDGQDSWTVTRAMVCLSRGGADAFVAREFDLVRKRFIPEDEGGFVVPEGKTVLSYRSRDILLVSSDFGPGSLTSAGYPRVVKAWQRGTPLSDATVVYEGEACDHVVYGYVARRWRREPLQVIQRATSFHASEWFLLSHDWCQLPIPADADVTFFGSWLLLQLRSDFGGFPPGALVASPLDAAMAAKAEWEVLWKPARDEAAGTPRFSTLQKLVCTCNYIVLQILDGVRSKLLTLRFDEGRGAWRSRSCGSLDGRSASVSVRAVAASRDAVWFGDAAYTQPPKLIYVPDIGTWSGETAAGAQLVRELPPLFEASVDVRQLEATSADGTSVPFQCLRPHSVVDPPTLIYAYGGFGIPVLPSYKATIGAAWLERGGQYVEAHLRGGGEFGPAWEAAGRGALGRLRAYEDLEAIADHLIAKQLATPGRLGLFGRSNGGLLVANQVVREMASKGPQRFAAMVGEVPLTDMLHYHRLLAGASWLEEYGDPDDGDLRPLLRQISAYHLAQDLLREEKAQRMPEVLFTTSTRDDRVHPCHARKMVELLQGAPAGQNVFLFEGDEGGHGGAAIFERAFIRTLEYEFLWARLAQG
ncbi:unnamed protein product [Symbiodinium sp. CCMP2456]|nr:unnamed protein product [Symbiodinium sp. CCMP2456]